MVRLTGRGARPVVVAVVVVVSAVISGCTGGTASTEKPKITATFLSASRAGGTCDEPSNAPYPSFSCYTYRLHLKNEGTKEIEWSGPMWWTHTRNGHQEGISLGVEGPMKLAAHQESDYVLRGDGTDPPDSLQLHWVGPGPSEPEIILLVNIPGFS